MKMNMTRWLLLFAAGLLCTTAAVADTVPGHYIVDLEGWDPNLFFNFMPNPEGVNPADYQNPGVFCAGFGLCGDPLIRLNGGGGSTPETGSFSFNSGTGTEVLDFQNAGPEINEVLITLTDANGNPIPLPESDLGQQFVCSSDLFQNCGFNNDAFTILFYNPINANGVGIPTATPNQRSCSFCCWPSAA
jgi:hypothetical protein